MGISGHKLGLKFYGRVTELRNRLSRARYFRGHGVHSPFVYEVVRNVFMRDTLLPGDRMLYRALLGAGVAERRAMQLQNLSIYCGYSSFGLNRADAEFCIATRDLSRMETLALVHDAATVGHTVAVMAPYDGRERQTLCRQIVASHRSTTVDNRGYLLVFNNNLPKQHFRI
ncbi:hypothetical protein [uncultured Alistipes sp.]|jgi:hypothetical protein|uniref:hypothetical protein n=1 Tax=uncultured Alistipes sp. TaxID=538949 RepID=UPI0025DB3EEC|nr:hypothetical protein [uncultured Alistipes sp.]